jgi:hypothetical protein
MPVKDRVTPPTVTDTPEHVTGQSTVSVNCRSIVGPGIKWLDHRLREYWRFEPNEHDERQ